MKNFFISLLLVSNFINCTNTQSKENSKDLTTNKTENTSMNNTIYNYAYNTPSGETKSMKDFDEKVILIVNTATQCGLTPQFEGLEKLHTIYGDKGLKVLGFPCNQFGGQEPLTDDEMVETCKINHGVTFELTKKINVNGKEEHSIYNFLKSQQSLEDENDIRWNFEKFLIDKNGKVVKRFSPQVTPEELTADIEKLL